MRRRCFVVPGVWLAGVWLALGTVALAGCGLAGVGADEEAWQKAQAAKADADVDAGEDATEGGIQADAPQLDAAQSDGALTDTSSVDAGPADSGADDGDAGDVAAGDTSADAADGAVDGGADGGPDDVQPPECATGTDCTGQTDNCHVWRCAAGACVAEPAPDGLQCEGVDICAISACQAGVCKFKKAKDCDDGDTCTKDDCSANMGCQHLPAAGTACDDGDACTIGDACGGDGKCAPGGPKVCDDANACTDDSCGGAAGDCAHLPGPVTCTDNDLCTIDACKGDTCVGAAKACSDGDPCTDDSCQPASGCAFKANAAPCDDGDPCTSADVCKLQQCAGLPSLYKAAWKPAAPASWADGLATTDGSVVLIGLTEAAAGNRWYARAMNAAGTELWTQEIAKDVDSERPSLTLTADGDFLALGSAAEASTGCVGARFDQKGLVKWTKTLVESANGKCAALGPLVSGKHLVVGHSAAAGQTEKARLRWLSPDGALGQATTLTSPGGAFLAAVTMAPFGAVACGTRGVGEAGDRAWLVAVDGKLALRWQRLVWSETFSGCTAVTERAVGGWFGVGVAMIDGAIRPRVFATNAAGRPVWTRNLAGNGELADAHAVGDGVAVVGMDLAVDHSKASLIRLSGDGRILLTRTADLGAAFSAWLRIRGDAQGRLLLLGLASANLQGGPQAAVAWRVDPWGNAGCAEAGKCGALMAKACADGNPCTDDLCVPASGCATQLHSGDCNDGLPCSIAASCQSGKCVGGSPRLWQQVYDAPIDGLASQDAAPAPALTALPGGRLAAVSRSTAAGAGVEALVTRTDPSGKIQDIALPHGGQGDQLASAIAALDNGGLVVGGTTAPGKEAWLLFISAKDKVTGQLKAKVGDESALVDLLPVTGGQVLALGHSGTGQGKLAASSLLLVRAHAKGIINTTVIGSPGFALSANKMVRVDAGHLAVGGRRGEANGASDLLLALLDDDGKRIWQRTVGQATAVGAVVGLAPLPDKGLIVAANTLNKAGGAVPLVMRTSPTGTPIWQWQFTGMTGYSHGRLAAMVARPGGAIGVIGRLGDGNDPANVLAVGLIHPGGDGQLQPISLMGVNVPAAATLTAEGDMVVAMHSAPAVAGQYRLRMMRFNGWGHFDCKVAGVCGDLAVGDCGAGLDCSQASCDAITGCAQAAQQVCDDGLHCSVADACEGGVCKPGKEADCDDGNACSKDACTPTAGCSHALLSDTPCADGAFCTIGDTCKDGGCYGKKNLCGDGTACTVDTCLEDQGVCQNKAKDSLCDDGHACTDDKCDPDKGCQFAALASKCEDGNICTEDECTLDKGCQNVAQAPGSVCASGKVCSGKTCTTPWAVAIAAGSGFSCVIQTGGQAWCWGRNSKGELGGGAAGPASAKPVKITKVTDATVLSAANGQACAAVGGGIMCWGSNADGKAVVKSSADIVPPTTVGSGKVSRIAALHLHTCIMSDKGEVACWGRDEGGAFADPQTSGKSHVVSAVAANLGQISSIGGAYGTTCVVEVGFGPMCTGDTDYVGSPKATDGKTTGFVAVTTPDGMSLAGDTELRSSALRVLGLADGKIWAWGEGFDFLKPWKDNAANPVAMPGKVVDAVTGVKHLCAVLDDGTVWCLGASATQTLGLAAGVGDKVPVKVPGLSHITKLAAGSAHTCALRADGAVLCWGNNDGGECGSGAVGPSQKPALVFGSAPGG